MSELIIIGGREFTLKLAQWVIGLVNNMFLREAVYQTDSAVVSAAADV